VLVTVFIAAEIRSCWRCVWRRSVVFEETSMRGKQGRGQVGSWRVIGVGVRNVALGWVASEVGRGLIEVPNNLVVAVDDV